MNLLFGYIDLLDSVAKYMSKLLGKYFKVIRIGPIELKLRPDAGESYERTFKKIEAAQNNLSQAVEAIDNLKIEYTNESKRLEKLLQDVKKKREEYQNTSQELNFLQRLTNGEREQLRRSLGINEKRSKVIGFVAGVLASLIASGLWLGVPKLWDLVVTSLK